MQVIKKVKEHHKKKKKELKKLGKKAPKLKDPGIPSQWPFKEELIKEFAWKKQQILMQEKEKRDERKRAREVRREDGWGGSSSKQLCVRHVSICRRACFNRTFSSSENTP